MRVAAAAVGEAWPEGHPSLALFPQSQAFVTRDREYEVHAVVVWNGHPTFQIVNDIGLPDWMPAVLFRIVDPRVPGDWTCTVFEPPFSLALGPAFITADEAAYTTMVELHPDQVRRFWARISAREREKSASG